MRAADSSAFLLFRDALRQKTIPHPRLRLNILPRALRFEFPAQLTDKHTEILRLMGGLPSPHSRQQSAMSQGLPRIARHEEQQVELRWRQVQALAAHGDRMRPGINQKVANLDRRVHRPFRRASQVGPYSSQELLYAERLGDIVVGARIERLNFGSLLI